MVALHARLLPCPFCQVSVDVLLTSPALAALECMPMDMGVGCKICIVAARLQSDRYAAFVC